MTCQVPRKHVVIAKCSTPVWNSQLTALHVSPEREIHQLKPESRGLSFSSHVDASPPVNLPPDPLRATGNTHPLEPVSPLGKALCGRVSDYNNTCIKGVNVW